MGLVTATCKCMHQVARGIAKVRLAPIGGVARRRVKSNRAADSIQLRATLLPSPDHATTWPTGSFRAAGIDEAADRLAGVLREEDADLLVADDADREPLARVAPATPMLTPQRA